MCNNTIEHKNKNKCKYGERDNKPCSSCSRSSVGKKNGFTDTCPICSETLITGIGSKRNNTVKHAATHNLSIEELFNAKHNTQTPLCKCGCEERVQLKNWIDGYNTFILGHQSSIWTSYDKEKATEISERRKSKLRGKTSWAKGLTKETDERVKKRGDATSISRKKAFDEGKIKIWNKGLTKQTDERIKQAAIDKSESFRLGHLTPWAKGLTKETDERVKKMAERVSVTHKNSSLRQRLDNIKRLTENEIRSQIESGNSTLSVTNVGNYINDNTPTITVVCNSCGTSRTGTFRQLKSHRCWTCNPGGSMLQADIINYIKTLNVQFVNNDRKTIRFNENFVELDVYFEQQKLALEINGLYWHSLLHKSMMYHQQKSDACDELGIKLFHIFEDEWRDKRDIVESMIKHRLGLTQKTVFARKCQIVQLDKKQRTDFFNKNHIDGDVPSNAAWGLLDDQDDVVCALSVRRPFHKKHSDSIEIARMCSVTNTSVVGGLSKLTKHVIDWASQNEHKKILTYVDTRLGAPDWSRAGYTLVGTTPPRFWWTDNTDRFNRFKYKANKKNSLTEAEVASQAGVTKIYGCKNQIYEIRL